MPLRLRAITYVSRSELLPIDVERAMKEIVEVSRINNLAVNLTGALLYTGTHFAQVIEGESFRVAELLLRLQVDTRHSHMRIVSDIYPGARSFGAWSMAYSGPDPFARTYVEQLSMTHTLSVDADRLIQMLRAVAK